MPTLKIKQNGKWVRLPYIIKVIQRGEVEQPELSTIGQIEQLMVSYIESKKVGEVEN